MPKVSIAMASYNHRPYVAAALQSALDQSFQDFEIIVTDDGSTDGTAEEIATIRDRRVSLETSPRNYGGSVALNSSILRSHGEYIAVLNSDDLFLPGKLQQQVEFLDANPHIGAVFGYPTFIDSDGNALPDEATFYRDTFRVRNRSRAEWLRHFFFLGNVLCHPSVLIRRRCYDTIGLYNPALAQIPDLEMWIRVLHRFEIHLMETPLVGFRILKGDQNASAGRPDAIVRVQWEWTHVLSHYLTLDNALLSEVFPELPRAFPSSPYPRWMTRLARSRLDKVTGQPEEMARTNVNPSLGEGARAPLPFLWFLGELAWRVGKPPHVLFGLAVMHRAIADLNEPSYFRDFIGRTGSYDLFDVLSKAPPGVNISHDPVPPRLE